MRRARIFLVAVAVVGIAGAAMASSVRLTHTYYTKNAAGTACDVPVQVQKTIHPIGTETLFATPTLNRLTSGDSAKPCWTFRVTPSV